MRAAKKVYLSLGSNLGDRAQNLEKALSALEQEKIWILKRSSVYETEPQDVAEQPWFLNMAVECDTRLFPLQLLGVLQGIERNLGRVRDRATLRNGPRVIDIDMLLYADVQMDTPALVLPHPRMFDRRFVLEPLVEIAPGLLRPGTKTLLSEGLKRLTAQKLRKVP